MNMVLTTIPTQPIPFFVRPIAVGLCKQVLKRLVDPNVNTALAFMNQHLASHKWFAWDKLTLADFQMSFAVEAALSRGSDASQYPHLQAYHQRMVKRPTYQRAIKVGGPVIMS